MSLNAVKHGLTSNKMFVLQNENPAAWVNLLAECIAAYNPVNALERGYVEAIAFALWRLRRIYSVQTALVDLEMDEQSETFAETYQSADETIRRSLAIRELVGDAKPLANLGRYEAALQRAHDRAVKNLENVRKLRNGIPPSAEVTTQL